MEDIVFKPKYKITLWMMLAAMALGAALSLVIAVSMFRTALTPQRPDAPSFEAPAVLFSTVFILIAAGFLSTPVLSIRFQNGILTVKTLLGYESKRRCQTFVYYESGYFFICGFVFVNRFIRNPEALDDIFTKLSDNGRIKYLKNKGLIKPPPKKLRMLLSILTAFGILVTAWAFCGGSFWSQQISFFRWYAPFYFTVLLLFWFFAALLEKPGIIKMIWGVLVVLSGTAVIWYFFQGPLMTAYCLFPVFLLILFLSGLNKLPGAQKKRWKKIRALFQAR